MAKTEPRESEFPFLAYLDKLVEDLRDDVPNALKQFDAEAVHGARVSTRRLKAAVDLLEPVLTKDCRRPFSDVLRKLRRRLGPLRDLDVMLGHLEELGAARPSAREKKRRAADADAAASTAADPRQASASRLRVAAGWLSERLSAERSKARDEAGNKSVSTKVLARLGTWWGLRDQIVESRAAIDTLLAESLHLQLDAFAEQAEAIVERVERPAPRPDVEHPDPHALRIAGKALRYTLEMAAIGGHELPADVMKAFKKMQESLGLWHDYVVLTEKSMHVSLDEMLPHHDAATQGAILDLARSTLARAEKELTKFAHLWTGRGRSLVGDIRAAFPLTRACPRKKAPPASTATASKSPHPWSTSRTRGLTDGKRIDIRPTQHKPYP